MTKECSSGGCGPRAPLTAEQEQILLGHGTEYPGSSPLNGEKRQGTYHCAACGTLLFRSTAKYESGSGWPSFWAAEPEGVATRRDTSHGMVRQEVHCAECGGHLGHVFPDGPPPTGLRYCMNGLALDFRPEQPGKAASSSSVEQGGWCA
ncbi:MAG: peptide-methionine (R)-S-oxide reductase MsrB [Acetobacter syzygii]|uniref:peptide-methionine (R)-S-oxide reductase MsrB n=1 Tax=Acetobacter syzygii TaxID=146476 RepID=UPI0005DD9671|nr:peptide-methionine (R)-S-oxide reductase MsrB [Acetobacter syzygii]GAN70926.1 peptide methionine sulfoxide reductase MsrB [Acetobacter syzygii]GBR66010.1 peptide methionine sulfoxide reductase [Acetobacter syzygii NRIC 0483]GEL56740.1 peptide-methionine (R)-S-oxide reductase [Acetobacter syzygii]